MLTRGITFDQFNSSTQQRHGPTWLSSPSEWPRWPHAEILLVQTDADEEVDTPAADTIESSSVGLHHLMDLTRFSKLSKLLSVTVYVYQFISNVRHPNSSQTGPPTVSKFTQDTAHPTLCIFQRNNERTVRPQLFATCKTTLFIDKDMLRCGGRIHNAPLSELAKFPYLLPAHHYFTTLVIQNIHITHLHSGVSATLTALRQSYWIPSA